MMQNVVLLNKQLVKTVKMLFQFFAVGSFDPPKGAIQKNYPQRTAIIK